MKILLMLLGVFFLCAPAFSANDGGETNKPSLKNMQPRALSTGAAKKEPGQTRLRQPQVEIWLPPEFQSSERKWPLIVFSHGFGGCNRQSDFLTSYLADHGYIVIAPNHADAKCRGGAFQVSQASQMQSPGGRVERPEKPFRSPESWNEETEADRKEDVLFAVASMLDDRQYKNYVDTDRMGLLGYSLGGYTVLGLAGGWDSWHDPRFKAVAALSPFLAPYAMQHGIERIEIPILYQGGSRDFMMTPPIKRTGGAYNRSHAPKYYIELKNANHYAWTELDKDYQEIIKSTVLGFFDRYLKGEDKRVLPRPEEKKVSLYWKEE